MKHFYNIVNKYIDKINLEKDLFALTRKKFFENECKPYKDKYTLNDEGITIEYDFSISMKCPMKWDVIENGSLVTQTKVIDNNTYSILFFNNNNLFKKLTFSFNHILRQLEYFDMNDCSVPICQFEPRMSRNGLVIVYKRQGTNDQIVLSPIEEEKDIYIKNKLNEEFSNYIVKANTDNGIVYFLSSEQEDEYKQLLDKFAKEKNLDKDERFIEEEDISLGKLIDPKSFNIKKNLASNININDAEEFICDTETEENIIINKDVLNINPDKIISKDMAYKYYGEVDNNGNRNGYGRTVLPNEIPTFIGEYKNDKREGNGLYFYKDGSLCYCGEWKENNRNGFGIGISSKDNSVHVGNWSNNKPIGDGIRLNDDKSIRYIRKVLSNNTILHISFNGDNVSISQYDKDNQLLSTKGFSNNL